MSFNTVEFTNERFKNLDNLDEILATVHIPAGLIWASGDYDVESPTFIKGLYVTYHTDRKPDWPRTPRGLAEIRDDINGGTHCPVVADEPTGAAEAPRGDSRSSTASDFGYYAACAAQMGAGATFHSDDGIASRFLGPVQKDCARAFFAALAYIPPDCQFAPYTRGGANNVNVGDLPVVHHDLEEPTDPAALRSYSKTSSDGFNYYNRIRARGGTVMNPGWQQNEEPTFGIGRARK